jgi:hypothetical protein
MWPHGTRGTDKRYEEMGMRGGRNTDVDWESGGRGDSNQSFANTALTVSRRMLAIGTP